MTKNSKRILVRRCAREKAEEYEMYKRKIIKRSIINYKNELKKLYEGTGRC